MNRGGSKIRPSPKLLNATRHYWRDRMTTKVIFFTGGVLSSVGKGVTAAAIGRLLKARGFSITSKAGPLPERGPGRLVLPARRSFCPGRRRRDRLTWGITNALRPAPATTVRVTTARSIRKSWNGNAARLSGRATIQVIPHITNEIKRRIALVGKASTRILPWWSWRNRREY